MERIHILWLQVFFTGASFGYTLCLKHNKRPLITGNEAACGSSRGERLWVTCSTNCELFGTRPVQYGPDVEALAFPCGLGLCAVPSPVLVPQKPHFHPQQRKAGMRPKETLKIEEKAPLLRKVVPWGEREALSFISLMGQVPLDLAISEGLRWEETFTVS